MGEERLILPPPQQRRRESEILKELPNVLGLVLWQDVRHLDTWAASSTAVQLRILSTDGGRHSHGASAGERESPLSSGVSSAAGLFNPSPPEWVLAKRREASASCPELAPALAAFRALVAAPLAVRRSAVAEACRQVVEWALAHEHVQTAIEFAEAAARVDPESPAMANLAG